MNFDAVESGCERIGGGALEAVDDAGFRTSPARALGDVGDVPHERLPLARTAEVRRAPPFGSAKCAKCGRHAELDEDAPLLMHAIVTFFSPRPSLNRCRACPDSPGLARLAGS